MNLIKLKIFSGIYPAGEKLPSIRELSKHTNISPNTIQKALNELEKTRLIYNNKTKGRFVSDDKKYIESIKNILAEEQIKNFNAFMGNIGFTKNETICIIKNEF